MVISDSGIGQRRRAARAEGHEKYRQKLAELTRAAAEVFQEKGFDAATFGDIAERLGVDRASLYYYVGGKEELLRDVVQGVLDQNVADAESVAAAVDLDAPQKLELLVTNLVASYGQNYPYMYVYIQEDMTRVAREDDAWARRMMRQTRRFESLAKSIIEEGVRDGSLRKTVDVALMVNALFGMVNWTHRWMQPAHVHDAKQVGEVFSAIFLGGVLNNGQPK